MYMYNVYLNEYIHMYKCVHTRTCTCICCTCTNVYLHCTSITHQLVN